MAAFVDLNAVGGQLYFWRKAEVKYSMLLNPEENAISPTGFTVLRKSNSAFLRRMASRNWYGEQAVNFLNTREK